MHAEAEAEAETVSEAEGEGCKGEDRVLWLTKSSWGEAEGSEAEDSEALLSRGSSRGWEERRAEALGCRFGTPMRLWGPPRLQ